ncbi:hypothetical protein BSPLISOX_2384 [uncultured Gammaproteobacteria bacterium]|jgi:hypothetical protein|nr:hypothetical protein [uncultured Gammaproteobacteria bacterium]CAC9470730.1 hypothetical protein [uncultured Gammaproteobacteria bacterium]VVH64871.1 hypothetical protein BSPLISOX_2384 [uncultured Gammaproteobacteria bacterium]
MSHKTYEKAMESYERYVRLSKIEVGGVINTLSGSFVVARKIEDECGFFIFEIGKFNKRIYENSVLI